MDTFAAYGLSRRKFLKSSVGGSLLMQAGLLCTPACAGYADRTGEKLKVFDAKTAAIIDALADAMIDDGTGRLPKPSSLGIAKRLDDFAAGLHPDVQEQTVLLFNVVEHFTLPFGFYFKRFTKLSLDEQKAYLRSWADSSLGFRRMAAQALKMFVYVNYYTFPETWDVLGYDGPWVGRFEMPHYEPPLATYTDDEAPL